MFILTVTSPRASAPYSSLPAECLHPQEFLIPSPAPAPETFWEVAGEGLSLTHCIYHLGNALPISPSPFLGRG